MATDATFVTNIDLSNLEIRNAKAQILSSDPAGAPTLEGRFHYNTTDKQFKFYNGSSWVSAASTAFGSIATTNAFGQANADGSANTAARSDHKHQLPAHDDAAHSLIKLSALAAPTSAVSMGGQKITNLAAGSANGDAMRYEQVVGTYLPLAGGTLSGTLYLTSIYGQVGNDSSAITWANSAWNLAPSTKLGGNLDANTFKVTNLAAASANGEAVRYNEFAGVQTTANGALQRSGGTMTGTITMSNSATIAMGGAKITGMADGSAATDAVTKQQLDAAISASAAGLEVKASARVATTANITLSGTQTIDGVAVVAGDRVLVKNQSTGSQNGIYVVAAGAWTRAADFDTSAEASPGSFAFVEEGTLYADTGWVLTTNAPITLGTTALTFTQFSGPGSWTAGNGLTQTGTTIDVVAGNGLTVAADAISLNYATGWTDRTKTHYAVRKYSEDLGSAATQVITHNLNTRDVNVTVRQTGTPWGVAFVSWEATSVDTITIYFATTQTAGAYRVTVTG